MIDLPGEFTTSGFLVPRLVVRRTVASLNTPVSAAGRPPSPNLAAAAAPRGLWPVVDIQTLARSVVDQLVPARGHLCTRGPGPVELFLITERHEFSRQFGE